jgi:hypothetical protein
VRLRKADLRLLYEGQAFLEVLPSLGVRCHVPVAVFITVAHPHGVSRERKITQYNERTQEILADAFIPYS